MGFCRFLITDDPSFRLLDLELSTRSQTSEIHSFFNKNIFYKNIEAEICEI